MHIASSRREDPRRSNLRAGTEPTRMREHAAATRKQATLTPHKFHDSAMYRGMHVKPSSDEGSPAFAGLPRETLQPSSRLQSAVRGGLRPRAVVMRNAVRIVPLRKRGGGGRQCEH